MSAAICPNGHASDEADYCSVCGAPIAGAANLPPAPAAPVSAGTCPVCGTARDADARFCEVCRYDFETGTPGPPPVGERDPQPTAPDPAAAVASDWDVTVSIDLSLDVEPDPNVPAPSGIGDRVFPIDLPEMLVGRRDERHDIRPEIPMQDPAVSRRHAKLLRLPSGGLAVLDLASANGTAVNGVEIAAGERHPLSDGDTITMGRWTKLTVHRRT